MDSIERVKFKMVNFTVLSTCISLKVRPLANLRLINRDDFLTNFHNVIINHKIRGKVKSVTFNQNTPHLTIHCRKSRYVVFKLYQYLQSKEKIEIDFLKSNFKKGKNVKGPFKEKEF